MLNAWKIMIMMIRIIMVITIILIIRIIPVLRIIMMITIIMVIRIIMMIRIIIVVIILQRCCWKCTASVAAAPILGHYTLLPHQLCCVATPSLSPSLFLPFLRSGRCWRKHEKWIIVHIWLIWRSAVRYLERDLWDVETSKIHIGAVKTKRYCSSFVEKSNNLGSGSFLHWTRRVCCSNSNSQRFAVEEDMMAQ